MSDTYQSTRASINRLKVAWAAADEDTRWTIGFWGAGIAMMAAAIIVQFGWVGLLFCQGAIFWRIGR